MTELANLSLDEMADDLRRDDLAKPDLMTAGMTFATLALVETLTTRTGRNLADTVAGLT